MEIEVIESQAEEVELQVDPAEEAVEREELENQDIDRDEDGDLIISLGDDPAPAEEEEAKAAPQWVKDLRKTTREQQKKIRELEAQVAQAKPKDEVPALGAKPTLEGCDYDAEEFEKQYDDWLARKQKVEAAERDRQRAEEEKQKAWQVKVDAYAGAKEKLKVKDYEDAEETVVGTLAEIQQQVIIAYAKDPALMVYAIGKNPKEMARLAAITDPIEFALEMRDLEKKMKVEKRKPATQPESTVTGTAPKSGAVDNQLERLRAEAAKTGDYSKVTQYKRMQKEKQKA